MRISVVVPVFDAGASLAELLASLRAQSLDRTEWEAVLVDDGSTDGSSFVLDRFAAELPNVRVLHTPNSGWPGRPRNLGLDAAQGEYVFFSDADDRLDPEALQRLADFAAAHAPDVLIGRVVGVGRNAPTRIFRRTVVDAQEDLGLLMTSLTPQKLFRRAFLLEQGIRFPEGKRRLEDQFFVTVAYLRATRVSVYADHPIYYFTIRPDGRNISRQQVEWRGYFVNAGENVAVVDAEAPDEETRLTMRSRWLRTEAISRLRARGFVERPDRAELLAVAGDFVRRHYSAEEVDRLGPFDRMVGRLLLDRRDDDVVAFAEWEARAEARVEVLEARFHVDDRRLEVRLRAAVRASGALPQALSHPPDGYPSAESLEQRVALPRGTRITARFRRSDGNGLDAEVRGEVQEGVLTATALLDLSRVPASEEGAWRLRTTMRVLGRPQTPTPSVAAPAASRVPSRAVRIDGRRFRLVVGRRGRLVLHVDSAGPKPTVRRLVRAVLRRARRAVRSEPRRS